MDQAGPGINITSQAVKAPIPRWVCRKLLRALG